MGGSKTKLNEKVAKVDRDGGAYEVEFIDGVCTVRPVAERQQDLLRKVVLSGRRA